MVLCAADFPQFARPAPEPSRVELAAGWTLTSARAAGEDGALLSTTGYAPTGWHSIATMPATVLGALQQDGTYRDLYVGTNLRDEVPPDLWRQDWWYRTTFTAPGGHSTYLLEFPGINYRAEVWLNGHRIGGSADLVGMYVAHEIDATRWIRQGEPNVLAVKVTPERALQDVDGVELADSWYDWINWEYLGYRGPPSDHPVTNSYVPDRNAGIFKPVYLQMSEDVSLGPAAVTSELPLPRTDSADLTLYTSVRNHSAKTVHGVVRVIISRPGKPTISIDQRVSVGPGQEREVSFDRAAYPQLSVDEPDLWWPYTMGDPALYDLRVEFRRYNRVDDARRQRFGIREISQHRDADTSHPELGAGGNFYLTVNGKDLLVRGAAYAPDLLFTDDAAREAATLRYAKDLGLNMLRLEGKFPGERLVEEADELGIPLMAGWMCCNQWEKWSQWDAEDNRVARQSLASQIAMLRSHASAFVWANGSDGRPPPAVLDGYHRILTQLHWPNAVVDTVSSMTRDSAGQRLWDGIHMAGPYSWRPPSYWFAGRYAPTRGATAEQGDNEHIPPLASLRRFIPPDKLWPINETWFFHAGANASNSALTTIRRAIDRRYGPSADVEAFTRKAQVAQYESTRAQFEAFAAGGWDSHKMTIYWMLDNHWPSFFGHLFDYYLRPGGAYYGAKKGLRPLSVVFDSYATGNHDHATVAVVNQTPADRRDLQVRVRVYDVQGRLRDDRTAAHVDVASGGTAPALTLPRVATDSPVFFVRCEVRDGAGTLLGDNVYWQSQRRDDVGDPRNDQAFELRAASWADMAALNTMARAPLQVSARRGRDGAVVVRLHNPGRGVAFFERAEILSTPDGDEILPVEYSDNYVTVFGGETVEIRGSALAPGVGAGWVRVSGYNTAPVVVPVR
ncbi:beta-galactosidase/beta-glucuronidase [Mycolicibacterium chubuense NBB4]|uniref:Beta-galactosidase/beta-glucuronidase n=1 Tax=Mycolicibacterium chubuense (strain NBB4) TaxID=710421 RepID=I4BK33_MYCCN|nr:beta-galactosidase/beta-glucuronidase [Mycolicibacterium chubuense NBB4]